MIDGCIELRTAHGLKAGDIESIDVDVHPLVLELTGKKTPQAGLEGKFSVYHSAAVAIIDGAAGETQYSDARVRDPQVIALRDRVHAKVDAALHEDAGRIRITLRDGRVLERFVEHAIGSLARPLTDAGLEDKFRGLVIPVLGAPAAARLLDALWQLDASADVAALPLLCVPAEATRERSTQRAD